MTIAPPLRPILSYVWCFSVLASSQVIDAAAAQQPQEVWRSRDEAGLEELTRVAGAVTLRNGMLAVLDAGAHRVFLLDENSGRYAGSFGRQGAGPGEFLGAVTIGRVADSLWVGDSRQRRITVFSNDGKLVRTIPVEHEGELTLDPTGGVIAASPRSLVPGSSRRSLRIERLGPALGQRVVVLDTVVPDRVLGIPAGRGMFVAEQPFDDGPLISVARGGGAVVQVDRSTGSTASPPFATIRRLRSSGEQVFQVPLTYTPIRIPSARVDGVIDARVRMLLPHAGGVPERTLRNQIREAMAIPVHLPTVSRLAAFPDGSTWLRREDTGAAVARWTVLGVGGEVVAELALPAGALVLWAEARDFYAFEPGADGVPVIVRYRLSND